MNISVLAALALILCGGMARAKEPAPALETSRRIRQDASHREMGTVVAVNAASGKLSVKDKSGKMRSFAAMRAKVQSVGGKTISLADISIGDEVSVAYNLTLKGKDAVEIFRLRRAVKR